MSMSVFIRLLPDSWRADAVVKQPLTEPWTGKPTTFMLECLATWASAMSVSCLCLTGLGHATVRAVLFC